MHVTLWIHKHKSLVFSPGHGCFPIKLHNIQQMKHWRAHTNICLLHICALTSLYWINANTCTYILLKHHLLTLYILQHVPLLKWSSLKIIISSIQPEGQVWQEPEPSQATGMALAHCILGSFLGVGCHCFPPPLDVPTFASRCLHVQATCETSISERRNYGREMAGQFCLRFRLPRKPRVLWHAAQICDMGDGFTSSPRKACCGFFRPKNPTASAGIEPAILGTRGQHANH